MPTLKERVLSRDGGAGLVCLGGSALLLWMVRGLPQPALVPIGPGSYPGLLFGVTAVLSAGLVVADLMGRGQRATGDEPGVVLTFTVFAGYVCLLPMLTRGHAAVRWHSSPHSSRCVRRGRWRA